MPKGPLASRIHSSVQAAQEATELTAEPWSEGSGPHTLTWFLVVSDAADEAPVFVGTLPIIPQLPPVHGAFELLQPSPW